MKFRHEVTSCNWDQHKAKWHVAVKNLVTGETIEDESDLLISARGGLNAPKWPDVDGLSLFKGKILHSAMWDENFDFSNKKIGVIGGGSSAIQIIPHLQKLPGVEMSCFIRSKTWISPPFGDHAMEMLKLDHKECKYTCIPSYSVIQFSDPRSHRRGLRKVHGGPSPVPEIPQAHRSRR